MEANIIANRSELPKFEFEYWEMAQPAMPNALIKNESSNSIFALSIMGNTCFCKLLITYNLLLIHHRRNTKVQAHFTSYSLLPYHDYHSSLLLGCHVLFTHAREGARFLLVVTDWLREDEINRTCRMGPKAP
ncbi:uncharacterized protein LOC110435481 isoform X2 [Sorghum bicolor]|uniref:uncharacterized protein LOC110435481 isoform X2 n=1 Tax=Sorghum bicolor TaxID=4558 RepID=UPI000B4244D7|nr:uncharacterized protein LOC110435481 isoform X2 [Sorghum bicolor]|eukprot:XP_021316728.1 uncharacterized protein LOC110435481 isoform X2 [Sorghum bicolor]